MKQWQKYLYCFVRIELIVIQPDTFLQISSTPEATIFSANAFIFFRGIHPTSGNIQCFSFYMCSNDLTKVFNYPLFYLDSETLKECLMLMVL